MDSEAVTPMASCESSVFGIYSGRAASPASTHPLRCVRRNQMHPVIGVKVTSCRAIRSSSRSILVLGRGILVRAWRAQDA